MTIYTQHSATIHQFPLRGRFAQSAQRDIARDLDVMRVQTVAAESGWYHDEAIRESEGQRRS